ncbi:MAG: hypothetical protein KIT36_16215 [Alphaproteobacteria bacterium]|nr:hypothetical protein [Alphaproteobacteria bacterium]
MARANVPIAAFNRGIVSPLALARIDLERLRLCAETCVNWMPQVLGPMSLRPGLGYVAATRDNAACKPIPFVAATTDAQMLLMTGQTMRVLKNDALVSRPSVATVVTNGDMSSATGWAATGLGGATASWGSGLVELHCPNRGGKITIGRSVGVALADRNVLHAVRVVVVRGPVTFRVGTASGDDSYVRTTTLRTGTHSLAFTPVGDFYVEAESDAEVRRYIDSIQVEAGGILELPTAWPTADLAKLRWDQSADVMFVACAGYQQQRIERRDNDSWSVCAYDANDGPFTAERTARVRMRCTTTVGNASLITDAPFFKPTHVGAIFRLFANTQVCAVNLARDDVYTTVIRVFGNNAGERTVNVSISGTWSGTITLERSFDGEDSGFNGFAQYTANTTTTADLTQSGTVMWVRLGFRPNEYTSGVAVVSLAYVGGGRFGIARVNTYTSATQVECEILRAMPTSSYTEDWREGMWSPRRGYPTALAFYEGRLWWFGKNAIWGSVSDAYDSFDAEVEGDSGPLNRTIGSGPVDNINWALPLQRLLIGTDGAEVSLRSSSFDEPLTPTQFTLKDAGNNGSDRMAAVKVDQRGFFVQAGGVRIFQVSFDVNAQDYQSREADVLVPEIGMPGIAAIAAQRQPETRVHFVREDGTAAVMIFNPVEEVSPFVEIESPGASGFIEDVCVLPGQPENQVYYIVRRVVNGQSVRHIEKLASWAQSQGDADTRLSDAHVVYSGAPTSTVTGLAHLEGEAVVVWADGRALWDDASDAPRRFTVAGGQIAIPAAASTIVAGLPYTAQYRSAKLAYAAALGTALGQKKKINYIGLSLYRTHPRGLLYGGDFAAMDRLKHVRDGATVDLDAVIDQADEDMTAFPGNWDSDARLCLQGEAPLPCTVRAVVADIQTMDHA